MIASVNTIPDKSVPVNTAFEMSTPVPIIYPPYAVTALTTNEYVGGSLAGGPLIDNPPLRILRRRAFVKSAPLISAPVITDPTRVAPLKSE